MNNLYTVLEAAAGEHPERIALRFGEHTISYQDLMSSAERLATAFSDLGIRKGDRIAVLLPNVPHFVVSLFALMKIGATMVPVSMFDKTLEVHHQLEDSEVRGVIFWEGKRDVVQQATAGLDHCETMIVLGGSAQGEELDMIQLIESHTPGTATEDMTDEDTAFVFYTAGITGRPKGAELTHVNILSNIEACRLFLKPAADDAILGALPFSIPVSMTLVLGTFLSVGASVLLLPKFDLSVIYPLLSSGIVTYFLSVPTLYRELLEHVEESNLESMAVKFWLSTGDAMKQDTMDDFETRFGGLILEGYGLTEAGPMVSFNSPLRDRRAGSIGLPLRGVDLKIVNEEGEEALPGQVGEILVKGPGVMKGYLNRPEATKTALEGGWLHTGDLAIIDESGFPFIVGRKKNVIMKSGFSVYPREVEKFLVAYPKIADAVVIGLPDATWGEEIHACIVLREGESATEEEIINYSHEMMAAYKCPKTVTFMNAFPKGTSGRVLRKEVRQLLEHKLRS